MARLEFGIALNLGTQRAGLDRLFDEISWLAA
jgi:hypothetical protein